MQSSTDDLRLSETQGRGADVGDEDDVGQVTCMVIWFAGL